MTDIENISKINNINIPLVVSYENNMSNNPNSQLFKASLEKCGWDYLFIGEGQEWKGFKNKINNYYNCLLNLPSDKIIVLSDARDVFCLRTPFHYMKHVQEILNNKILISAEMFLLGHMNWTETLVQKYKSQNPYFFWQGVPLDNYWAYHNRTNNLPLRKYVNSGLISGKVENILKALKWILDNNYEDDQLGFAEYTNKFPENVILDHDAKILHTSTYGVNGGNYESEKQYMDSPTIAEILGMSSYFLHIPGINISKGQNYVYNLLKKMINDTECTDYMYKLYNITPNLNQDYFIKNT
jgi:hypothetical protein